MLTEAELLQGGRNQTSPVVIIDSAAAIGGSR
jgi:hypothetical protein